VGIGVGRLRASAVQARGVAIVGIGALLLVVLEGTVDGRKGRENGKGGRVVWDQW